MDRFVGRASLEWWANRESCLEKYGIDIIVTVDEAGTWQATGRHANLLDTTQREGWDFLMEMDPRSAPRAGTHLAALPPRQVAPR
jgi:hypothetical protein